MKSLTPQLWLSLLGASLGIAAIIGAVLLLDDDEPGESPPPSLAEPALESNVAPAPVAEPLAASGAGGSSLQAQTDNTPLLTVTTTLDAGFNLVVWTGDEADPSAAAAIGDRLQAIFAWDAAAQAFQVFRVGGAAFLNTLSIIGHGQALWLLLSAGATVSWTHPALLESRNLSLLPGFNLVAWSGPNSTPVAEAVAPLGDALVSLALFQRGGGFQIYDLRLPTALNSNFPLPNGAGMWVRVARSVLWAQPPGTPAPDEPLIPSSPPPDGYSVTELLHSDRVGFVLGFEPFPNGDAAVALVAQEGRVWRWDVGRGGEPTLFADISDRVHAGGEEGLLGLAFSPTYPSDHRLYLYYSAAGPRRSVLSRFTVIGETVDPASEEILLEVTQPFSNHNGGQLTFGPDDMLYLALGDGGSGGDPLGHGQNLATLLGSILRLDVSAPGPYRIPLDNPFVDVAGAQPEIFAYGLRNPWRFSFDSATGALWAGDVGQDAWEEVDRIVAGGNYGWNITEGFACFTTPDCDRTGLQLPRAVYGHDDQGGCSITGGFVYRGAALPELDGWYVYGDLCSGRLWALNTTADSEPVLLLDDLQGALVTFGLLPGGELAAVTSNEGTTISRLERRAS